MRLNIVTILQNFVNHSPTPNYRHFRSPQMLHVTRFYVFISTSTRNAHTYALFCQESPNLALGYVGCIVKKKWGGGLFRAGLANLNPQEGHKIRLPEVRTFVYVYRNLGGGIELSRLLFKKKKIIYAKVFHSS
jgi:hypothetical protein